MHGLWLNLRHLHCGLEMGERQMEEGEQTNLILYGREKEERERDGYIEERKRRERRKRGKETQILRKEGKRREEKGERKKETYIYNY
jgi:hypothetical protein